MPTTYRTETNNRMIRNKSYVVINIVPDYSEKEKRIVKRNIEQQLYDVFEKYMQSNS